MYNYKESVTTMAMKDTCQWTTVALGTGVVFLVLQLKEYNGAFFTFSDSTFGSDFYGTTCLHGLHVTTGSLGFGIL